MNNKILSLFLFLLMVATCLAQSPLKYEDIKKGFDANIQGKARLQWFDTLYVGHATLTNSTLRTTVAEEMTNILQSKKSNNQDKCAAAYIIGLFSFEQGIQALIDNFRLYNQEPTGVETIYLREGEWPAQHALVMIGEPALPYIIEYIEKNDPESGARIVLHIMAQGEGRQALQKAIKEEPNSEKKLRLEKALASEYFNDSKYELSGPKEKVKRMLAQKRQHVGVTNRNDKCPSVTGDMSQQPTNQTAVGVQP